MLLCNCNSELIGRDDPVSLGKTAQVDSYAEHAVAAVQVGDTVAEEEFLTHCRGAHDTLAFMLARRALMREGRVLGAMWEETLQALQ